MLALFTEPFNYYRCPEIDLLYTGSEEILVRGGKVYHYPTPTQLKKKKKSLFRARS